MASRTKTYKVGSDLDDAAELRAKEIGYASGAAYLKALLRYDILCRATHHVTIPWSMLPLEDQDKIDAALLARARRGQGMTAKQAKDVDWRSL
jgi:hypothetical protein